MTASEADPRLVPLTEMDPETCVVACADNVVVTYSADATLLLTLVDDDPASDVEDQDAPLDLLPALAHLVVLALRRRAQVAAAALPDTPAALTGHDDDSLRTFGHLHASGTFAVAVAVENPSRTADAPVVVQAPLTDIDDFLRTVRDGVVAMLLEGVNARLEESTATTNEDEA